MGTAFKWVFSHKNYMRVILQRAGADGEAKFNNLKYKHAFDSNHKVFRPVGGFKVFLAHSH